MNIEFTNLDAVIKDLQKVADKLSLPLAALVRSTSFEIYARLIPRTPVDTGRARGNWMIGAGQMDSTIIDQEFPAMKPIKVKEQVSEPPTMPTIDMVSNDWPVIYITNSLNYVYGLNEGKSDQASEGMTSPVLAEIGPWIDGQVKGAGI